jgi:phage shock protein PspC (stress-responsive transcriptional regulator)
MCLEKVNTGAQRCPHCRSWLKANPLQSEWYRGGPDAKIAGVCSGLAMQFPVSVTIIRLAFVLGTVFAGGIGLVLYIILWFIMPKIADG